MTKSIVLFIILSCAIITKFSSAKAAEIFPARYDNGSLTWNVFGREFLVVNKTTSDEPSNRHLMACLIMNWSKHEKTGVHAFVFNFRGSDGNASVELHPIGKIAPKEVLVHSCTS